MKSRLMQHDRAMAPRAEALPAEEALPEGGLRRFYDEAPLFAVAVSPSGTILHCNQSLARHIGRSEPELIGARLSELFADSSVARLDDLIGAGADGQRHGPIVLKLRHIDGSELRIEAIVDWASLDEGCHCLRIVSFEDSQLHLRLRELERSDEMLRGLIDSSTEPIWCIEYAEPVDISVSDREIIRQIFENECYWSMCNDAMARLYDLPEGLDFNRQPVALYFPRSLENDTFAQSIIDSGFHIDHALSVDHRHDGTPIYVENSVRCHIEDGRLLRMWGTLRDVTKYQRVQNELTVREREVRGLLSAIADIVLMVDRSGRLQAANPAFNQLLGWSVDEWLGKDLASIVNLKEQLQEHPRAGKPGRFAVTVRRSDGKSVQCDVVMSMVEHGDGTTRFVAVMRPLSAKDQASTI